MRSYDALPEDHDGDTKRDERYSAEHQEPFEHHAARRRKRRRKGQCGRAALHRSTIQRHPQIPAPFAAPVLDAWGNGDMLQQLNFVHAARLVAVRTRLEFPGFSGDLPARLVSRFKLLRTHTAQMTMAARAIVERVDIIGHVGQCQRSGFVDLFLDPLLL